MNNLAFQIYGSTKSGIFQSTWKTDNAGVSSSTQIELPLLSGGTYNFWIDWGDGSTTNVTSYSQRTHTYASAGTYTLRATGIITGWGFQNTGDKLKILTISSWGKLKNLTQGFYGCSNLTLSGITDILDLTGTTSLGAMFSGCSKITTVGRMNEWDTSLITSMSNMFVACVLFNQPLNNWNTGNVTGFVNMFTSCYLFNQCIGSWNVTKCTSFEGMFYNCYEFNNGDNSVPLNNWILNTTSPVSLNYPFLNCKKFNRYIGDWNTSKVNIMASLFSGCTVFNNGYASGISNQLPWNTSACTNMSGMFQSAPAFNSNLGTGTTPWDVSKVTSFTAMFNGAGNFNNGDDSAPINNWSINTVSSVTMSAMFSSASVFNRDVSNWNMTKVTNTSEMFRSANLFNQPLNGWERAGSTMGNITNMMNMFRAVTLFNQNIGSWNVSKVTTFQQMFQSSGAFNNGGSPDIGNWTLNTTPGANVILNTMFGQCVFNQPLNGWNTSEVTNMSGVFLYGYFNNGLSSGIPGTLNWNTSKVTTFNSMFAVNSRFNCNIGSWDVSNCIDFGAMFQEAHAFNNGGNSSIGTWILKTTVGSNVNMGLMFQNNNGFNQNIGAWNVSQVNNFTNFMLSKTPATFSSTNLDAIYNGWIVNGVKPNINISFGTAKYTAAGVAGRLTLTSAPNNWIITDGGL